MDILKKLRNIIYKTSNSYNFRRKKADSLLENDLPSNIDQNTPTGVQPIPTQSVPIERIKTQPIIPQQPVPKTEEQIKVEEQMDMWLNENILVIKEDIKNNNLENTNVSADPLLGR